MRWVLGFVLLAASVCLRAGSPAPRAVDVLFVGFDAGETDVWAELVKEWETELQYAVLTMGTSTSVAKQVQMPCQIDVADLGIQCPPHRLYELSEGDLARIAESIQAACVVTGLYSSQQRQIAELYKQKGARVIGYWDNFSPYDKLTADLVRNLPEWVRVVDQLLTPTFEIAHDLNTRFAITTASAVGQPTLEVWKRELTALGEMEVRRAALFQDAAPILVWMGGYEERGNHYNDAFKILVEGLKGMRGSLNLIVQLHPKATGAFERSVLEEQAEDFPCYVLSKQELSMYESAALSTWIACQRSIAGVQALFAGKSVFYVDVQGTPYTNLAIDKGLSERFFSGEEVRGRFQREAERRERTLVDCYAQGGVPLRATEIMRARIEQCVRYVE
jgi:hypothetical protein